MMLDKMKQLYEFQKKAKAIQRELEGESIEVFRQNGKVGVVFDGGQKIRKVSISEELLNPEKKELLEHAILECVSEAVRQSQKIAAGKMKQLTGGMGIPGL